MAQAPAARTDSSETEAGAAAPASAETAAAGTPEGRTRRGLLIGAGLAGVAGLAAACGGDDEGGGSAGGAESPAGNGNGNGGGGGGGGGKALAATSEIPVGGGKVFEAEKIVVVQPAAGQFKAYSSLCTHRRCPVDAVAGGTINCPCHGSKFKIADGSVANPPATEPLEEKQITVQGDQIMLA
ncbi:Rieske (2Fe-2S) protein [Spirillospora sp. CA-255316]